MNVGVPAVMREHAADGDLDGGDVAVPAELGDEAAARLQRAMHPGEHRVVIAHPVQRRVRKHRVEFALERQTLRDHDSRVDSARRRGGDHLRGRVDADNRRTGGDNLLSERTFAAADVENPLSDLGIQELEDCGAERRHVRRIGPVGFARPAIHSGAIVRRRPYNLSGAAASSATTAFPARSTMWRRGCGRHVTIERAARCDGAELRLIGEIEPQRRHRNPVLLHGPAVGAFFGVLERLHGKPE